MKQQYELTIQPITGVHVGSGETLTPMEYLIRTINNRQMYLTYDSDSILRRVISDSDSLQEYETACSNENMSHLFRFFDKHFTVNNDLDYACEVTEGFLQHYNRNKNNNPLDNAREVLQMYRPKGKKAAVIPGSSLKGSIRTAVLNLAMYEWNEHTYYGQNYKFLEQARENPWHERNRDKRKIDSIQKKIQGEILGEDPKTDVFRSISLGDCRFDPRGTQVVGRIQNIVRQDYDASIQVKGIPIYAEVLKGSLMGANRPSLSRLSIDLELQQKLGLTPSKTRYGNIRSLLRACNYFFKREFYAEEEKFYQDVDDRRLETYHELHKIIDSIPLDSKDTCIIRLGRWSQVEFVTFASGYRLPKTPKNQGYGNTRMVFDFNGQLLPLGWCKCTVKEL